MIAKIWKKVLLFVLIIACLFNIVNKASMEEEVKASAQYVQEQQEAQKKQ